MLSPGFHESISIAFTHEREKKKTKPLLLVVQILEITQVWLNLEFSSDNNLN